MINTPGIGATRVVEEVLRASVAAHAGVLGVRDPALLEAAVAGGLVRYHAGAVLSDAADAAHRMLRQTGEP